MADSSLILFLNRIIQKMKLRPFYNVHPHSEMRKMHLALGFLSQCTKHEECLFNRQRAALWSLVQNVISVML